MILLNVAPYQREMKVYWQGAKKKKKEKRPKTFSELFVLYLFHVSRLRKGLDELLVNDGPSNEKITDHLE